MTRRWRRRSRRELRWFPLNLSRMMLSSAPAVLSIFLRGYSVDAYTFTGGGGSQSARRCVRRLQGRFRKSRFSVCYAAQFQFSMFCHEVDLQVFPAWFTLASVGCGLSWWSRL